ncbi:MAG: acyl-ACP--UDP-N-acetylglucosamine O-acyltransferase [Planctomycetes bacterium]|nr:acyl-ACP--UDP-N-acetylglucosamine O-acyltransferase [Planctomycetota bacterium]
MAQIDPTSHIGPEVTLAEDVIVGPHCSLTGRVTIGPGTRLVGHTYVYGPVVIGSNNIIYPFCCIGFAPQDFKFDPNTAGPGVVIGDRNLMREQCTIHRATHAAQPTTLGSDNMLMLGAHLAHDVQVGSRCVLTNNAGVAGHSVLHDQVILSAGALIAHKVHIGRLVFIGGGMGAAQHVPPFAMSRRIGLITGINIIGMRRAGMGDEEIRQVRWAHGVLLHEGNTRPVATERIRERADHSPALQEILAFLESITGAIMHGDRE